MKSLSLTARVSLLFGLVVTVVLFSLGWLVAWSVDRHFQEMDRHELEGKLALVANLLAKANSSDALDGVPKELDDALVGHDGLSVTLVDAQGNKWFASRDLDFPSELFRAPSDHGLTVWREGEQGFRGLKATVTTGDGRTLTVAIVLDISHHLHFIDTFKRGVALAMILAALLTAGLGWLAVRTGLLPLRQMIELATGLSANRLDQRLPESGLPPEIRSLAVAFNAMLERLEDSFVRLSEFSSDIAHELRTPVSNLLTQTQVALSHPRTAAEYREVLQSSAEEYERLARMIGDMLFLAKADNKLLALNHENVDLGEEAGKLVEFYGILAEEQGVRLEVAGSATTRGDRLMLRRAMSNLLSNAIRHSQAGGTVAIRLSGDATHATLVVENPGSIPPEQLPRLFDRFYTGDPSRRAGGEGVGLGLAIVRSIMKTHGGSVDVTSQLGLTCFVLRLPGQEDQQST
ncbi:MAG: heavy metal sensor histidine kinase [Thiobacillaceae bacterium]|nr:heavy metal sensor histidine kinase [Thiobacillaceae bacterium]